MKTYVFVIEGDGTHRIEADTPEKAVEIAIKHFTRDKIIVAWERETGIDICMK